MTLDEAIKHCEEKAEELNHKVETWVHCPSDPNWKKTIKDFEDCKKCAEEHEQLAKWLKELVELRSFAQFVTYEVVDDKFKENADCFAEVACRKLVKLGYVKLKGDTYWDIVNVKNVDEPNSRTKEVLTMMIDGWTADNLISREALKNTKPEFMNEKVVRDTKYQTTKDRIYARAWNDCNSYWLNIIDNCQPVKAYTEEEVQEIREEVAKEFKDIIDNLQPVNTKMKYQIEVNGIPIEKLGYSSVTVEARSQGKWILHKDYNESCKYGCNKCGNLNNIPSNFCPNCGADMRGEKE